MKGGIMRSFDYSRLYEKAWDTDILNLVAKIHECKGRQDLFIRQKPVELDRLVEIAKIQSTEASNKIEGIVTTSTRMKQLFEERVGLMSDTGNGSTAYDIVKKYTEEKIGKFTGAEVVAHCPSIERSSALAALKKLTDEGFIIREGSGRSTFYIRTDSK